MGVSGELHTPPALPRADTGQEAGWAPQPIWTRWWKEKHPYLYRKSNPGRPACSLVIITEWAMPGPEHLHSATLSHHVC
jgi:hypothetical protein